MLTSLDLHSSSHRKPRQASLEETKHQLELALNDSLKEQADPAIEFSQLMILKVCMTVDMALTNRSFQGTNNIENLL